MSYKRPEGLIPGDEHIPYGENAFAIIGAVRRGLKAAGNSQEIIDQVTTDMKRSDDYDQLQAIATAVML